MTINKIQAYLKEYSYLKSIMSLLHWDMEVMMPKGAIEDRAHHLSFINGKLHSHLTAKKYKNLLDDLKADKKLKPLEKKLLKELLWDFELSHALPLKHVQERSRLEAISSHAWAEARRKNDWESFRPHLDRLIALKKREAGFFKTKTPYDALLRMHDKEFDARQIDKLFDELKKGLLNLRDEVIGDGRFVKVKDLKGPFEVADQKALSEKVARIFGLPASNSRLDISTHPFSINISPKDQRITTRYDERHLDSLGSTMHEVGHALYEAGLPAEWEGTPFQEAVSLSVHESQSRFWENIIGRSRSFCEFIHPEMVAHFPKSMKGVSPENLFYYFNKTVPGLIRVESSELYYNFHVIIRYEIEEMIFNGNLKSADLPAVWNDKYELNLGSRPKTYSEGILQDSHWAGGAFGYFPTYTLGNLITGSLWARMRKEIKTFESDIRTGNFAHILNDLRKNIHSKGRSISAQDIVGELQVKDYLSYLKEKFRGK